MKIPTGTSSLRFSDRICPNSTRRVGAPGPIFAASTVAGAETVTVSTGSVDEGSVTVTVSVVATEDVLPLHPTARPARARSPAARSASVRPMRRILVARAERAGNRFLTVLHQMEKERRAGVASRLPAASIARTRNEWLPCLSPP